MLEGPVSKSRRSEHFILEIDPFFWFANVIS